MSIGRLNSCFCSSDWVIARCLFTVSSETLSSFCKQPIGRSLLFQRFGNLGGDGLPLPVACISEQHFQILER